MPYAQAADVYQAGLLFPSTWDQCLSSGPMGTHSGLIQVETSKRRMTACAQDAHELHAYAGYTLQTGDARIRGLIVWLMKSAFGAWQRLIRLVQALFIRISLIQVRNLGSLMH